MSRRAVELVAQLLEGEEARAASAVNELASLTADDCAAALDLLGRAAVNGSDEQRSWAVQGLAALPHGDPLPMLLLALQDAAVEVRQSAALALRQRPDSRAVPQLVALLDDANALVARLAVDALAAAGSASVSALLDMLASGSAPARLGALRALATIGDPRAIPALFAALDGTTLEEYWASAALERMGVGMSFFNPGS